MEPLAAGIYRTTKDIENPRKRDRRVKRDWREEEFLPAGTVFEVVDETTNTYPSKRIILVDIPYPYSHSAALGNEPEWFQAIMDSNPESHESLRTMLHVADTSAEQVLEVLMLDGFLTKEAIKEAIKRAEAIEAAMGEI